MPGTFRVDEFLYNGEKPNPHGGVLHKFKVSLTGESGDPYHDVYWQRKSRELEVGEKFYGHIEQGEFGPRFKTDQRPDGNFQAPSYPVPTLERQDDRSARIERQSARRDAISYAAIVAEFGDAAPPLEQVKIWTDQLDADVGSGQAAHGASDNHPPVAEDAADLSAGRTVTVGAPLGAEEASPQLKGTLTQLFNKAGLSREAMKAVVLFRCGAEKATKQGAEQLITDLQEGATHDALLAEVYDAKRAGNPLGARAAALIPSETPWDGEGLPPAKDITT